jgi:hypothetical protein
MSRLDKKSSCVYNLTFGNLFLFISFRMNNTCVILVLFFAFVSCTLSSYLDIPPPPERPMRFKTKEQIENYLKSVKDYYDAFKIKLVRRENSLSDFYQPMMIMKI